MIKELRVAPSQVGKSPEGGLLGWICRLLPGLIASTFSGSLRTEESIHRASIKQ